MASLIFRNKKQYRVYLSILAMISPAIIYYLLAISYAINIPLWDEYYAGLLWIEIYVTADFPDNVLLLFKQHNEHRLFTYQFTVLSQFLISGELNFKSILIFGNFLLILLALLVFWLNPIMKKNTLLFTPVSMLLFSPQIEITNWGIMTLNGILQYVLVLGSLFLLNRKGNFAVIIAIFLAAIATFSFGNGMFTFLAGFFIIYFDKSTKRKKLILWGFSMLFFTALYFINYNTSLNDSSKLEIFHHPIQGILFFLTFFGSNFRSLIGDKAFILPVIGFCILAFFVFIIWKNRKALGEYRLAFSFLIFIILSAGAATIARAGQGYLTATAPRYALLPVLFISIVYIIAITSFKNSNKIIILLILIASTVLFVARIQYNNNKITNRKTYLEKGLLSYYIDTNNTTLYHSNPNTASRIMSEAIKNNHYSPPKLSELFHEIQLLKKTKYLKVNGKMIFNLDKLIDTDQMIQLKGWGFLKDKNRMGQKIGIVLSSETNSFIFSTFPLPRKDVIQHFKNKYSNIKRNCGFDFILVKSNFNIPPGSYLIGACIIDSGEIIGLKYSKSRVNF